METEHMGISGAHVNDRLQISALKYQLPRTAKWLSFPMGQDKITYEYYSEIISKELDWSDVDILNGRD